MTATQEPATQDQHAHGPSVKHHLVEAVNWNRIQDEKDVEAVSYTHLTLPTKA